MRLALCVALTFAATPALAMPVYNAPADVQAVTALEKQNNTDLNLNKVMPNYAQNAVVYDLAGPAIYTGHAQIAADFGPQLKALKALSASFPSINVLSDGTMACAATQLRAGLTLSNGTKAQVSLRILDILRKVGGKWLIEQQHLSFPADPKTSLSLTDAAGAAATPITFTTNPFPGPRVGATAAKMQIKDWTTNFATALTLDTFLPTMGPGDDMQIFDLFLPTPLQGRQPMVTAYGTLFSQLASASVSYTDFRADTDGYIGAQIDTQKLILKLKNGSALDWTLRQSDCLHYVDGHWYSVFDELSFPMDSKSGKAVMN